MRNLTLVMSWVNWLFFLSLPCFQVYLCCWNEMCPSLGRHQHQSLCLSMSKWTRSPRIGCLAWKQRHQQWIGNKWSHRITMMVSSKFTCLKKIEFRGTSFLTSLRLNQKWIQANDDKVQNNITSTNQNHRWNDTWDIISTFITALDFHS